MHDLPPSKDMIKSRKSKTDEERLVDPAWEHPPFVQRNICRVRGAPGFVRMADREVIPTFQFKDAKGAEVAERDISLLHLDHRALSQMMMEKDKALLLLLLLLLLVAVRGNAAANIPVTDGWSCHRPPPSPSLLLLLLLSPSHLRTERRDGVADRGAGLPRSDLVASSTKPSSMMLVENASLDGRLDG